MKQVQEVVEEVELENQDVQQAYSSSPYVDWDDHIQLPSRKERLAVQQARADKNKNKKRSSKADKASIADIAELDGKVDLAGLVDATDAPSNVEIKPISKEAIRKRRIRFVRKIRFLRAVRRVFVWCIAIVIVLLVAFWWKFVYVYDLPDYVQAEHPHVKGFIAWKSWTFGPPILDLRSNGNPHSENEISQYLIKMDTYKDVIQSPFIIWAFKE